MKNKYFMKNCLYAVLLSCFAVINTTAQTISEYKQYDFVLEMLSFLMMI